ncbi:hypothetical protein [Catenulispora subtropica]|uniref:DUF202 domain-containing protein n=1 Tax=Catenulispora subtropica TaxID=450798 RepID=A0ABP5C0A0_9ACTN
MVDEAAFDEPHDAVMELVLSSDDEYAGIEPGEVEAGREERRLRRRELAARFLPGVDAGALFALGSAVVSLTSASMIEILAQNREIADSYSHRSSFDSAYDPLATLRELGHTRFLGQGAFAGVAIVVALAVLARWRSDRHARWARPAGQAALLLGVVGVTIALLGLFDVIGALPSPNDLPQQFGGSRG